MCPVDIGGKLCVNLSLSRQQVLLFRENAKALRFDFIDTKRLLQA
jgi:hypothetical protein